MTRYHFTLEQRQYILKYVIEGKSIRTIASILGKSPSSVSRELKNRRTLSHFFGSRTRKLQQTPESTMGLCWMCKILSMQKEEVPLLSRTSRQGFCHSAQRLTEEDTNRL